MLEQTGLSGPCSVSRILFQEKSLRKHEGPRTLSVIPFPKENLGNRKVLAHFKDSILEETLEKTGRTSLILKHPIPREKLEKTGRTSLKDPIPEETLEQTRFSGRCSFLRILFQKKTLRKLEGPCTLSMIPFQKKPWKQQGPRSFQGFHYRRNP